ncbi:MAG TPA: glycosyltransferase [Pseudonocardiaceae bacterium]|nr:glycosyltransferase [Pseudonocardiaceae bacterium]
MGGRATSTGTRVVVISGSVGAGHDGAADELISRLGKLGIAADRRDYLDALPRPYRYILRDGYRLSISHWPAFFDWLFDSLERTGWVRKVTLWMCKLAQPDVLRWVRDHDVVVSTYMLASQTLGQLKRAGKVNATLVTFLTDPAVHLTWVHPAIDHHVTVTEATARQGQEVYNIPMRAVGGLVSPRFAERPDPARREQLRAELGLSRDGLVALLATGSLGMGDVPNVVRSITASGIAEVVVLCGRNERLRRQLSSRPGVVALGWRNDVPDLMAAADVLVHNAGGLSLTEALTAGLPAVTYRPIPGHGIANSQVLADAGLAPWPKTDAELIEALQKQAVGRGDPSHVIRHPDTAELVLELLAERDQPVPGQDPLPA